MAKTKISEFSATANSNTDINSINIAEGCAPSNINDAIRELMAELKDFQAGTKGDSFNGPVGTTTAAAGAFTTLSSTGNTTLGDASGDTVTINGTATFANVNPTLSAGTANGVLYLNGSKVATSGSALTFDGTNFSIGSQGEVRAYNTANTRYGRFVTTADGTVLESFNGAGEPLILSAPQSSAYVGFKVNGSEVGRFNSTGLGIGTSSPADILHISKAGDLYLRVANTSTGINAYFGQDSNGTYIGNTGASVVRFIQGSSERARIDTSGNVGIGTSSPAQRLEIAAASPRVRITDTDGGYAQIEADNGNLFLVSDNGNTVANSNLTFGVDGTERARIDSSGNWLVGTTSSAANSGTGVKLLPSGYVYVVAPSTTSDTYNYYNSTAGAYRFYVTNAGVINATSTTITAISDQRLKENIRDLDDGLSAIMSLKPRKFDWKAGKGKDIKDDRGWIAQEFEQVFPDMIDTWKDPAPSGEEPYKSVRADLIPVLVKAIQELKTEVDSLKAQLNKGA